MSQPCPTTDHLASSGGIGRALRSPDVADQVIDTHIPWEQGLIDVPQVPEMKVFPGSSNVSCAIHWCLTAEVMHALGTGGSPDGSKARAYLTVLLERLGEVNRRHRQAIAESRA